LLPATEARTVEGGRFAERIGPVGGALGAGNGWLDASAGGLIGEMGEICPVRCWER
jgi:hypothetical protein